MLFVDGGRRFLCAILLVLLAFALRVYHLDYQSLWSDEGISLLRSGQPLGEMLRSMPVEHAPGYFVFLHFWMRVAGESDFATRFLSLWPSVLAVALTYRLGADLGSRRVGLAAALLLATNAFQVWYAQEARMYSWLLACGLAATWLLWRLLSERAVRHPWVVAGYAVLMAATVYLHHFGFLVPAAHIAVVLVWFLYRRDWVTFRRWGLAGCTAALFYLPWLPRLLGIFGFPGWRAPLDPRQLPWRYWTAYTAGDTMPAGWHAVIPWAYLLLALAGIFLWGRRHRMAAWLLAASVIVPLAGAFFLAIRKPDYHERYTIMVGAPVLLLAAAGVVGRKSKRAPTAEREGETTPSPALRNVPASLSVVDRLSSIVLPAFVLAGLVGANGLALHGLYTDTSLHKPNFRSAAQQIQRLEQPRDVVLVDGPDPEKVFLHYYLGSAEVHDLRPLAEVDEATLGQALAEATADAARAWGLLYLHEPGPVQGWLVRHAWPAGGSNHNGITLTLYGLGPEPELSAMEVSFDQALILAEAGVLGPGVVGEARAGDLLRVSTRWIASGPLPPYKFSLRLQDSAGRTWMAEDYTPQDGFAPTDRWQPGHEVMDRHGLLLPLDLPPGTYQVTLRLYDPASGIAVETPSGPDVTLATVEVEPPAQATDPAALSLPNRVDTSVNEELSLLAFRALPEPLHPEQGSVLHLWWRAARPPAQPYQVEVALVDSRGNAITRAIHPLSMAPADTWLAGQVVHEQYPLDLDPTAEGGRYRLRVALADADGQLLQSPVTLGTLGVEARARRYRLPDVENPLDFRFGDAVRLRGYDLSASAQPGGESTLVLYWQAQEQVAARYKVFVHVVDAGGQIVAQSDAVPAGGLAPTESWLRSEVVVDTHALTIPAGGPYRFLVGLYDPNTGQRPPVTDAKGDPVPDGAVLVKELEEGPRESRAQ